MTIKFNHESLAGNILTEFYMKELQQNTSLRAELKRCRSENEVMMTPAFYQLHSRFSPLMEGEPWLSQRLAIIVGLMSHIRNEKGKAFTSPTSEKSAIDLFIGPFTDGSPPKLSELRFRRVLQRDTAELYPALLRLLKMVSGEVNLYGLADSVFRWGPRVKQQWAEAYFPNIAKKTKSQGEI